MSQKPQLLDRDPIPSILSPSQKLAVAYIILKRRAPYFQSLLNTLVCVEKPIGTLGVTENLVLNWDPHFVERVTEEELAAVLMHEVMHVIQKHSLRFKRFLYGREDVSFQDMLKDMGDEFGNKFQLWNIAADLEINDDIRGTDFKLPEFCCFPEKFGLKENELAEFYYRELEKEQEKNGGKGKCSGNCKAGDGDGDGDGECTCPKVTGGQCGSCAGNPNEGETGGASPDNRTEGEIDRAIKQTAEEIQDHASNNRGNMPGSLIRWANEHVKPAKIRWQDKLVRACRAAYQFTKGLTDYDRKRMSRHMWGIGVGPGKPILPGMSDPLPKVWGAIDTSGSMSTDELSRGVAELDGIMKYLNAPITFLSCDYAVASKVENITSWRELVKSLKGGGGTSFVPVFNAIEQDVDKPNILVFVTDGCGDAPKNPPPNVKVIWVLVGPYKQKPFVEGNYDQPITYGDFIEIDD